MGIGTIMRANVFLVLATGSQARMKSLKKSFLGDMTPPGTGIHLQFHPNFILVGDKKLWATILTIIYNVSYLRMNDVSFG